MERKQKIICVVGPTASGKTALAVFLAKKLNGEIISADSRQVYRRLDIGAGKDLAEYRGVKYHLIDICEPEERFSVFDWLEAAHKAIKDISREGKVPIVAGGTGLYIQALVEGFIQTKSKRSASANIAKAKYSREELDQMPIEKLREVYSGLQEKTSNIDLNNSRRIIRAIEKAQEGSHFTKKKPCFGALQIGVAIPRPTLYRKIDERVDRRFAEGMLEEVGELLDSGTSARWLSDLGLEYRAISQYLIKTYPKCENYRSISYRQVRDSKEFKQMSQELKWKSHAFARRQLTWFGRFPQIKWVKSQKAAEKSAGEFLQG